MPVLPSFVDICSSKCPIMQQQTLRNLIAEGKTKKALSLLRGLDTLDKEVKNRIISFNTRYDPLVPSLPNSF
jgi:Effector-associated domain 11